MAKCDMFPCYSMTSWGDVRSWVHSKHWICVCELFIETCAAVGVSESTIERCLHDWGFNSRTRSADNTWDLGQKKKLKNAFLERESLNWCEDYLEGYHNDRRRNVWTGKEQLTIFFLGLPWKCHQELQMVQNATARMTWTPSMDHITPVIQQVHWLHNPLFSTRPFCSI